ncbi:hypothetical protein SDC9_92389 [bioreactor metagenome]|uniref:Uncharacterized protein n=1 Tax=bioreactor metagenome TaxID=1076179 RepID=A0A644ZZ46_9ZZZZ
MDECQALRTLFRRSLAALSRAGFPGPDHVHGAVPENISAVIENQAIALPVANPGSTTDHLNKKSRGIGWTQQHDTVGIRCIEPRGQHIHVDQEPQRRFVAEEIVRHRLALESGNDFSTFAGWRTAGHHRALHAGIRHDLFGDMLAMGDAGSENQHTFPGPRQLDNFPAGGRNQGLRVHRGGHFIPDELAAANMKLIEAGFRAAGL